MIVPIMFLLHYYKTVVTQVVASVEQLRYPVIPKCFRSLACPVGGRNHAVPHYYRLIIDKYLECNRRGIFCTPAHCPQVDVYISVSETRDMYTLT